MRIYSVSETGVEEAFAEFRQGRLKQMQTANAVDADQLAIK